MFWKLSPFLIAEVSSEWRLNLGFGTQKSVPFPWTEVCSPFNRGNKYKDYVNIFPGPNFVSPGNGGVHQVSLEYKWPKEKAPVYSLSMDYLGRPHKFQLQLQLYLIKTVILIDWPAK